MRKDAPYLKHDANASYNPKLMNLLFQEKTRGYGIYWLLLEVLRLQPGFRMSLDGIGVLSRRFGTHREVVLRVIKNYGLFVIENDCFSSPGLNGRLEAFANYLKGTLKETPSVYPDNDLTMSSKRYVRTRKPDQTKQDQTNSLSTECVRKVLSMDESIALLPSEQLWCEDMARRSGKGVRFTADLPRLLPRFASFIRIRGEEHTICGLSDAKRRFLYWMQSADGKEAIEELEHKTVVENRYRFETQTGEQRSYMGRLIPPDAPPRPDAFAVWDEENGKWVR